MLQFRQVVEFGTTGKAKRGVFLLTLRNDKPSVQRSVERALAADLPPIAALGEEASA